jgi:hypothetical protein
MLCCMNLPDRGEYILCISARQRLGSISGDAINAYAQMSTLKEEEQ